MQRLSQKQNLLYYKDTSHTVLGAQLYDLI